MKEKRLIQQTVPKDVDLFGEIYSFMKQSSWVYISSSLLHRLQATYPCEPYKVGSGYIFSMEEREKRWTMYIDSDSSWSKVRSLSEDEKEFGKGELYITKDPEILVFLY